MKHLWKMIAVALATSGCSTIKIETPCGTSGPPTACVTDTGLQELDPTQRSAGGSEQVRWQEAWLKTYAAEPWAEKCGDSGGPCLRPAIGLALAGGGSKSSPFAMGVIKRLVDDEQLQRIDLVSSVSGGGYAAYYLYHKAHETLSGSHVVGGNSRSVVLRDWYTLRLRLGRTGSVEFPEARYNTLDGNLDDEERDGCESFSIGSSRFQKWIACYQDILARKSWGNYWTFDGAPISDIAQQALLTVASLPVHHFANSLFDWGLQLSPSQYFYERGLIRTYGYAPRATATDTTVGDANVVNIDEAQSAISLKFDDLKRIYERGRKTDRLPKVPYWVIQATNGLNSSWFDVSNTAYTLHDSVFELGAYRLGSSAYRYALNVDPTALDADFEVSKAMVASAAFFDPLQKTFGWNRGLVFAGMHALNLRWGLRVENYNMEAGSKFFHSVLPFPLYYANPSFPMDIKNPYIRLADGGISGDNLGLMSQLHRGTRHIIAVDGAFDLDDAKPPKSYLPELCTVDAYLRKNHAVRVEFESDPNGGVSSFILEDVCKTTSDAREVGLLPSARLDPYAWKKPVWVGKIVPVANAIPSRLGAMLADPGNETQIYYIKSAADIDVLLNLAKKYRQTNGVCNRVSALPDFPAGVPCGLLYVVDGLVEVERAKDKWWRGKFPQNPTVGLTADSSAQTYYGYLWLGWYLAGFLCEGGTRISAELCSVPPRTR
jgi:hypothetical protein